MAPVPAAAQAVLDFWFGAPGSADLGRQRAEWFRKDAGFDALIALRFGPLVESAVAGELTHWAALPVAALARIVLLDQFTRNLFRDTPRAFAGDPQALVAARDLVTHGRDRLLLPVQRAFVYLPFEHSEDLAAQDEALRLFTALVQEAPGLVGLLDYAERHHDVVRRFGRFPHRNQILGRTSSAEEQAFLTQPGSRF